MSSLSEKLRYCRLSLNLRQEDVAHFLGISRRVLSRYETGVAVPSLSRLIQLSSYYGYSLQFFVDSEVWIPVPTIKRVSELRKLRGEKKC